MSDAFSGNEEECINRRVPVVENLLPTPNNELENAYELDRCAEWIQKNGFKEVGLLFPNNAWPDRGSVEKVLKERTGCKIINLDVPHTSCCFNEKNTTRHNLQCIIRFGHSCLTPHIIQFPVLYAFGRRPLDCENALEEFRNQFPDKASPVVIMYEVFYSYVIDDLMKKLKCDYKNIVLSRLNVPKHQVLNDNDGSDLQTGDITNNCDTQRITKCGRYFDIPLSADLSKYDVFYIGSENSCLKSLTVSFSCCRFFCYDPTNRTVKQSSFDINKYLRKNYHCIEHARDAKIICIVISATTLPNCIAIVDHLRNVILKSGKKSRQIHLTEELTTQKLGNYLEVEVFVYVACPETTLVYSHELHRPVITPYDLEVALNTSREWTTSYVTDYNELLPGGSAYVPLTVRDVSESDVSLITGRSRITWIGQGINSSSSSIALRGKMNVANINSSADFFQNRSWHGLEQNLGETPVAEIVQGMKGLAAGYEGEGEGSSKNNS